MSNGLPGEAEAAVAQAVGAVIQADGQHPRWDVSKDNAAGSAEIVTGFVKTVLLPLAVVNRLGDWVREKLDAALTDELRDVPSESIVPPLASVAGPALQGIGYSLEEDELRDMYVRLIASAMDGREPGKAHPSYAAIVASLSAAETKYLNLVLGGTHPLAEIRNGTSDGSGYTVMLTNLLPVVDLATGQIVLDPKLAEYIVNWERLGLVKTDWGSQLTAAGSYAWVDQHPQAAYYRGFLAGAFQVQNGILQTTPFGAAFAAAVLPADRASTLGHPVLPPIVLDPPLERDTSGS